MVEIEAQLSLTMEFDIDIGSVEYLFKIMTDIGHSSGYFEIVKNWERNIIHLEGVEIKFNILVI